jgi:hypothetical protein
MHWIIFYFLRRIVLFVKKQLCRVAGHNWQNTGIFGVPEGGERYEPVPQCIRCGGLKWKPKIAVQL